MSMKNGERESTYTAFVKPYQNSRNRLTVLTYSEVEQVILEGQMFSLAPIICNARPSNNSGLLIGPYKFRQSGIWSPLPTSWYHSNCSCIQRGNRKWWNNFFANASDKIGNRTKRHIGGSSGRILLKIKFFL